MEHRINKFWKNIIVIFTLIGIFLTLNQIFFWNFLGVTLITSAYLYLALTCFLSIVFLIYPFSSKYGKDKVPFYDVLLFLLTIVITIYFAINAENIINFGWDYQAPGTASIFSVLLWILVIDALRRCAGLPIAIITTVFSIYPLFANKIPIQFLQGVSLDFMSTAQTHSMGVGSILGLPLQTAATILIGFLLFGVVLQQTGGANFFYDLAQAVFGRARGGSAKVSIVSSGFMGMMSGSAVSNVLTTGPMTIPAMKKSGFDGKYAAAVEATASSGGSITPPIMGTAAFLMVSFIGVPYSTVALAAAIPAFLYYFGIFMQIDAYSAKNGLVGLSKSEIPKILNVLRTGWPYLLSLFLLIFLITAMNFEAQAPFYTILFLLIVSLFNKEDRMSVSKLIDIVYSSGKTIAEILGIIAGVGLIVGGLSISGVSLSLARELISLVGDNVFLILVAGAITSFVLGMGMTVSAVYVFLAIVMAPALVQLGVNPIAAHLFVIYWATVSYITPPVALASFAAAGIAKSPPMSTSLVAMKLGAVKYVIPFFFAINPALVAQGSLQEVIMAFATGVLGVFILACGFEGWLIGVGVRLAWVERIFVIAIGALLLFPGWYTDIIGIIAVPFLYMYFRVKKKKYVVVREV
ncbi:TRAP transporter permease [Sporosarcina obsidiansis]|uniref:TRAP transporter permease n=1 Tax=Sporosarcina obsidiansis TaxID=2660748 RepID=UPI00129A389C|nr:TRAP transporter permease [Sporosarcina obsidiansis]